VDGSPQHIFGDQTSRDVIYTANSDTSIFDMDTSTEYSIPIPTEGYASYIYGGLDKYLGPSLDTVYVAVEDMSSIDGYKDEYKGTVYAIDKWSYNAKKIPLGDNP
jgi:hypothetical protein